MRIAIFALLPALASVLAAEPDPVHLVTWDQPGSARVLRFGHTEATRSATASWSAVMSERPPMLLALDAQRILAVWSGTTESWYAVVALHNGRLHELASAPWPDGWRPRGAADFDGDGLAALLVYRTRGEGDGQSFDIQIAPARGGGFAFDGPVTPVLERRRGAYFGVGDMDGDGHPDVVYHGYDHGGGYQTELYMLRGIGEGRLAGIDHARKILAGAPAATSPLLGDFDGDGDLDVLLPPDDDVDDDGQAHVALNKGDGQLAAPTASLDFAPDREGPAGDRFMADGQVADFDGDGHPDILIHAFDIPSKTYRTMVHRGTGKAAFDAAPIVLSEGSYAGGPTPSIGWLRPSAAAPDPLPAADVDAARVALASERADQAGPAIRALLTAGPAAMTWIERKLTLAVPSDADRLATLLAELDSPSYAVRERATRAIVDMGERVEARLRATLAVTASLEVKSRLTQILKLLADRPADQIESAEDRRALRALAVLEAQGSDGAPEVLGRLAEQGSTSLVRRTALRAMQRRAGQD